LKETSCLTEHFFDKALERARFLDEYLRKEKRVIGPLHGLPVSIKDSFCVQGIQSTVGYVSFLAREPAASNSALVEMLLDLGAVLYVKTNVPQTMMVSVPSKVIQTPPKLTYQDSRLGQQHLRPHPEPPKHDFDRWRVKRR
jgi:Asp-tRNA(Asn)/Glu-tRNA(Gln) amidotransferase A subunit family amidase